MSQRQAVVDETSPKCLKRAAGFEAMNVKVYSKGPPSRGIRSQLISIMSTSEGPSQPRSLPSALQHLHHISLQAFSSLHGIQELYIHGYQSSLAPVQVKSTSSRLLGNSRNWHVVSQLYRDGPDRPSSRFLIRLRTTLKNPQDRCKVQSGLTRRFVNIEIYGHLKRDALDPTWSGVDQHVGLSSGHPLGPLQAVVDGILEQAACSLFRRVFASPAEMIAAIRSAVLSYLPRSSLAHVLDLEVLEVVTWSKDFSGERFVSNTLLNADGTEQSRPEWYGPASALSAPPASSDTIPLGSRELGRPEAWPSSGTMRLREAVGFVEL